MPTLIAVASLIPGLGFLMLGRWKSALLIWIFLIPFTGILIMATQIDSLECLTVSAMLVLVILAVQGVRAFKLARIMDRLKQGEIVLLNRVDSRNIQFDPRWTHGQRQHVTFGKRLETHLLPGERLQEWVVGEHDFRKSFWGNGSFCVGLLPSHLLICEFGVFDYPETIERVPRANVQIFSGARNGTNLLWIVEQKDDLSKKSIIFRISSGYNELLKRFNEQAHAQPMFKG